MLRRHLVAGALSLSTVRATPAGADAAYEPADPVLAEAALQEGSVLVCSTTFEADASAMLNGFREAFPSIQLNYHRMNSGQLYDQVVAGEPVDIAWSSAFDLQFKLVNDGYARVYASPEATNLPAWAIWRNEAYAT